jgi:putative tricarboxylic transport membrane protein
MFRKPLALAAIFALCFGWSFPVQAGNYPDKPITIVCWSSAGSGHDLMARILAKVGEKYVGQPMAVMNKKGGQGKVAMSYVLNKKPDGYTIMTNTRSMTERLTDPKASLNVDSFKYICRVVIDPFVVLVGKDSPFNSMKAVIEYAKKNPGALKIGGYSVQSVDQQLVNEIMAATGTKMNYIPYKGGLEPVVAVLGGHIDIAVANPSEMIANWNAGKLKVLATCSEKRFEPFADAPTLKELGIDVVEEHWRGLMASKDVPDAIINQLDAAFHKTIQDPEFTKFLKTSNMYNGYLPRDQFRELVIRQTQANAKK